MDSTILISYDSKRKILPLPASLNELKTEVYEQFGIDSSVQINLQIYNDVWEEYVDLSGDKDIVAGKKYMVLVSLPKVLYVEENSVTVANNSASATSVSVSENPQPYSFQPLSSSTPHFSFCTDVQITIPEEQFSETLRQSLRDEQPLTRNLRSEFVRTICRQVNCKYLPSLYVTDMARAIINTYPYLKEKIGCGFGGWRQSIRDWFKNMRRFDASEEVQQRKKNKGPNEKHKEAKPAEKERTNLDHQKAAITLDLDGSFRARRDEIVKNNLKVLELLEKYPELFNKAEFLEEFFRIAGKTNMPDCCSVYFSNNRKALNSLLKRRKLLPSWVDTVKSVLGESSSPHEEVEEELAIMTLPVHFCEEPLALIYPATTTLEEVEKSGSTSPHVAVIGMETKHCKYHVVAEHKIIMQCANLREAMAILMASYYILNCEYPKIWKNTLIFLENVVFDIQLEKKKIPSRVIHFVEKLKSVAE